MNEEVKNFTLGKGVSILEKSAIPKKVFVAKPDNFYSLKKSFKPGSLDFIYSENYLNQTKFYRIILKEWFYACKLNGFLVIQMQDNSILNFNELSAECNTLFNNDHILIKKVYDSNSKSGLLVLKKTKSCIEKNDSMDKWTFGIITSGKREDWVKRQIQSIKSQNIPHYEIILCGTFPPIKEKNLTYIHFTENDKLGWITRKKNIICENAKYNNLVIMHDRIILENGWYQGMKRYGNNFEVLSCIVHDSDGKRCGDWITWGNKLGKLPKIGHLEYADCDDKFGYQDGALYILKKSIWRKVKWDESLFWNCGEDIKMSRDFYQAGIIPRFNKYSSCLTLSWRHGNIPTYPLNYQRLSDYPLSIQKQLLSSIIYHFKTFIKRLLNKS